MIKVTLTKNLKKKQPEDKLGFGKFFTDYMFKMDYSIEKGWNNPRIEPYSSIPFDPSLMTFHYGQEIFDGLKAFKDKDNNVTLFRPRDNFVRMNHSAERLCIPNFDVEIVMEGLTELIKLEKDWIPKADGTALYIRPTIIATDQYLGVKASDTYLFFIILSPVGAYYAHGFAPVSLLVEDFYTRASDGGTGEAKCGGNYATSLIAGNKAKKLGFDQVLWMDAKYKKYIEEVGSMNMFVIIDGVILTPSLDGTILPGITRNSIIKVLKDGGYKVVERKISIDEIIEAHKNGKLDEAFGTGTAAVVSPVGKLSYKGVEYIIGSGETGKITQMLYDKLTGIQKGRYEDKFNWLVRI